MPNDDLTYTIRADATWGDGTPVTTADVLFTYEVGRNPLSGISNAELYRRITSIDAKDDKTFTMHVDKLTFDYAAINDFVLVPAHVERAAFDDPSQYRTRTRYATDPTRPGLYNGPYRISEIAAGSHLLQEPDIAVPCCTDPKMLCWRASPLRNGAKSRVCASSSSCPPAEYCTNRAARSTSCISRKRPSSPTSPR